MFGLFSILMLVSIVVIFKKLFESFGKHKYNYDFGESQERKNAIESLISQPNNPEKKENNEINTYVAPGIEKEIENIKSKFNSFVPAMFIRNAEQVFDQVFEAFANSQHQVLKSNLDERLYETFAKQIQKRDEQNLRQEISIEHVKSIIKSTKIYQSVAQILVSFEVKQMIALVDIHGSSPDNPKKIYRRVKHDWTFQSQIENEKWIVIRTHSNEI